MFVFILFWSQAQCVYGEGDDAGRPEAAMCAGLHTYGKSVEARLRGTVVVHGVREEVSNAQSHRCAFDESQKKNLS